MKNSLKRNTRKLNSTKPSQFDELFSNNNFTYKNSSNYNIHKQNSKKQVNLTNYFQIAISHEKINFLVLNHKLVFHDI